MGTEGESYENYCAALAAAGVGWLLGNRLISSSMIDSGSGFPSTTLVMK